MTINRGFRKILENGRGLVIGSGSVVLKILSDREVNRKRYG